MTVSASNWMLRLPFFRGERGYRIRSRLAATAFPLGAVAGPTPAHRVESP
jgi:hypothetical protein